MMDSGAAAVSCECSLGARRPPLSHSRRCRRHPRDSAREHDRCWWISGGAAPKSSLMVRQSSTITRVDAGFTWLGPRGSRFRSPGQACCSGAVLLSDSGALAGLPVAPVPGCIPCGLLVDPVVRIEDFPGGPAARRPTGAREPRPCWPHPRASGEALSRGPLRRTERRARPCQSRPPKWSRVSTLRHPRMAGGYPPGRLDCSRLEEPLSLAGVSSPLGLRQRSMNDH